MDSVSPPNRNSKIAQVPNEQAISQLDGPQVFALEGRVDDTTPNGQEGSHHSPQSSNSSKSSRRRGSLTVPKVNTTPDLTTAPQITATPPTPIETSAEFATANTVSSGPQRARATSTSKNPSKLSQSAVPSPSPPAVRGPESEKENSNASPNAKQAGGFFQSMFSVAQNAATTITNNIPLNLPNQDRNAPRSADNEEKSKSQDLADRAEPGPQDGQDREPAIKTLGSGELSLAALGITAEPEPRIMRAGTVVGGFNGRPVNGSQGDVSQFNLDRSQTLPVSGYGASDTSFDGSTSGDVTKARTPMAEDTVALATRAGGDITPDRRSISGIDDTDFTERKRSASVRSGGAASETRRRHRGSSAASQPTALVPRPTGFAVATKKRNRDFHNLFRSVPEDDYLIEDYGCALQKEILLQGRFYVSEGHICFYSNILGWVTQLIISFDEVVSVEKKSTALLFPNGLVIQTLHARHTFASFITRDATYDLIIGLWNVGHPALIQTPGEAHLAGVGNDGNESDVEEDEEYEDETDDDLDDAFTDAGDGAHEDGETNLTPIKNPSRKASAQVLSGPASNAGSAGGTDEFPGPATHTPTTCGDEANHYDKPLCNEVFPVPLGKIYSLLFGPQSYGFLSRVLTDEEKVLELSIPNNGLYADEGGKKTRQYTYIKPLSGPIGPKQTKCIITETIDSSDLEDHVTVTVSTQTPDVPSGGVFLVKTKYCLMWAENNSTRLIMNCTVEWSGKSWIKGELY